MKPKDIVIAAILIIIIASLVSGCGTTQKSANQVQPVVSGSVQNAVKKAAAVGKNIKMDFISEKSDNQVKVKIYLDNPSAQPVTSVQSWLSFDPNVISGKEINTKNSEFSLSAPYEQDFDNTNGLVMLGRSNPTPVTDKKLFVAEVIFDLLKNETVMVNAYDYRDDLTGHTSVNMMLDGKPYNILQKPESPALIIQK